MKANDENMEQRILESAENLFLEKGFNGTSTTEIAKEAGCTQALVHYYFRTKKNLFNKIFSGKINSFIAAIAVIEDESLPFLQMLEIRITRLFNLLIENPRLPFMLFNEYLTNPNLHSNLKDNIISSCVASASQFEKNVREQVENGNIRNISTIDLTLNIFSLTVSFFLYLPVLEEQHIVTEENKCYFLEQRKNEIIQTIIRSL